MNVYMDNAATTAVSDTALQAMLPCFPGGYGNPSSLHTPGQRAAELLAQARERLPGTCMPPPGDHLHLRRQRGRYPGAAQRGGARGQEGKDTTSSPTKFEHHAILHTLQALEKEGFNRHPAGYPAGWRGNGGAGAHRPSGRRRAW